MTSAFADDGGPPDSDGGLLDPDQATAYLQDWKGRVDRMAAGTKAMSNRLNELRVSAEDDNGLAQVTIDSTGALTGVRFTDRISRVAPEAVARAVMGAMHNARREAAERSRHIVTQTMGPDSTAGRTIADRLEQQLLRPPRQ
ncbi:YbaB/EbfC family nucleoid-associated protein, partial [Actinoplanes sp. TFC3]|uniref:YbaB/EbfC family nucleoid-associated protein n=1 Tax=Actinoplanes sp. TFC3 TaxID=1710355 RepID=UPI0008359329